MRKIGLVIGYDGTLYGGWQRQDNARTIQGVLEDTLEKLFSEKVHVMGSGRTDAGVHARGQVAAFLFQHSIPVDALQRALNSNLPEDIRIYQAFEAPMDFQPQYGAKKKTYRYRIYNAPVLPPEYVRYCMHVPFALDMERMRRAIEELKGEHDFAAFRAAGGENLSTIRTIYEASVTKRGELLELSVTGNGFLYHMVRIIAGTLIEIGKDRLEPSCLQEALETGSREVLGPTAKPQGLFLWEVCYEGLELPCEAQEAKGEDA